MILPTKLKIDLLIFDLDGTLTDSIPPAVESIQKMMAELGFPPKTKEEINQHVGFGELPLVSGAIGTSEPKALKKALETYFKHYVQEGIKRVPLYPHVNELLEHFKSKIKVIVSNKKYEFIKIILDNYQLTPYFKEILGGDTAPCLKPDPCMIIDLLKKYNVAKERALFIGDMTVDVETGKNAGIHTCAVTYGFDGRAKLETAQPDFLINDLLELTKLIE